LSRADDWKRYDDTETPTFPKDRKARAWFRRSICALLFSPSTAADRDAIPWIDPQGSGWAPECVGELLDWYEQHVESEALVRWEDDQTWSGRRFANGHWTINGDQVTAVFQDAVDHVDREHDRRHYPTLDTWLAADIAGELWFLGEQGGIGRINRHEHQAPRARKRKACRCCGRCFAADRWNAAHCDTCRRLSPKERRAARTQLRRA
jgi:hypothetical protein